MKKGAKETIRFPLKASDLTYWDTDKQDWVVESGLVKILIGGSSSEEDLKLTCDIEVFGAQ